MLRFKDFRMIKKVLGMTASTLIVAGAATPALATNSDVFNGMMLRVQGHYMESSNDGAAIAERATQPNAEGRTFYTRPNGDWDMRAGLEFVMPGDSNSSLVLDYDRYSNADSADVNELNLASVLGAGAPASVNGRVKFKDHAIKLGARRGLELGSNFDLNVGAYAEYAKVERTLGIDETTGAPVAVTNAVIHNEVEGWGPSFDIEGAWYPMGRHGCFSIVAGAEFAALWADNKVSARAADPAGAFVGTTADANRDHLNTVQTRFGATAALAFSRPLNESIAFGIRAGARWVNYHNAFAETDSTGNGDYGRFGPFIELRIGGADARA